MRFELRATDDGSLTVFDGEAGECFKSRHAARAEAEHVFFRPAVLEHPAYASSDRFQVLELGFGLGTNLLHFLDRGFRGGFLSVDRDLSGAEFFLRHEPQPALARILGSGELRQGAMEASLRRGDFHDVLEELCRSGFRAHAALFDPFSPKANPQAWTTELFSLVHSLLLPGGRLVTYSVSRAAKESAGAAGFTVEKRPLPAGLRKRSALLATRKLPE